MNCQHFETIINDLARNQIMDAALGRAGLTHAEVCARCAARLADERALTAGLGQVARSIDNEEAPARVEALLLAAFREHHSPQLAPAPWSRRWSRWAIAAAAMILLAFALIVFRFNQSSSNRINEDKTNATAPRQPSPVAPTPDQQQVLGIVKKPRRPAAPVHRPERE